MVAHEPLRGAALTGTRRTSRHAAPLDTCYAHYAAPQHPAYTARCCRFTKDHSPGRFTLAMFSTWWDHLSRAFCGALRCTCLVPYSLMVNMMNAGMRDRLYLGSLHLP